MDTSEIIDSKSLEAWLNARPEATRQRDAVWIAMRTAARVFPLYGQQSRNLRKAGAIHPSDLTALPILRCLLTSGVAAVSPTPEVREAARAAARAAATARAAANVAAANAAAAYAAARAAANVAAAYSAARAAANVAAAYSTDVTAATWEQIRTDGQAIEGGEDASRLPLWSGAKPDWFQSADAATRQVWAKDPLGTWDFWTRWWDGVLSGRQLDWALQEKVALIDSDTWKQRAIVVAGVIRQFNSSEPNQMAAEASVEKAAEMTRHGAVLFYDASSELIREETVSRLPQDVRNDAADLMRDILDSFPASVGGNDFYGVVRRERDIVEQAIGSYSARPRMFLTTLRRARSGVEGKILDGTCPKNDPVLNDFVSQIAMVETWLVTHDEEVKTAVSNQNELPALTFDDDAVAAIRAGSQELQKWTEPGLQGELAEDLATLFNVSLSDQLRTASMLSTAARLVQTYAMATGKGLKVVYKGTRFAVSEAAGWSKDIGELSKNAALVSAFVAVLKFLHIL